MIIPRALTYHRHLPLKLDPKLRQNPEFLHSKLKTFHIFQKGSILTIFSAYSSSCTRTMALTTQTIRTYLLSLIWLLPLWHLQHFVKWEMFLGQYYHWPWHNIELNQIWGSGSHPELRLLHHYYSLSFPSEFSHTLCLEFVEMFFQGQTMLNICYLGNSGRLAR